jgi:hypothetical protein
MTTIPGTFEGFKNLSKEYFLALPTLDYEGIENGFKCLGLAYLGCTFAPGLIGDVQLDVEAPAVMRLAAKARILREIQLDAEMLL